MSNSPHETYAAERDTLVTQIKELAERDERIRAAWLFGSLGRGTADVLSDIDVFFVVSNDYIAEISAQRREYVARIGNPQLLVEAPQNAPKDGAYLMAWYSLNNVPCCVDWYWQPQSEAVIPTETIILCDKDGSPRRDTPTLFDGYQPVPETTPLEAVTNAFAFSWAMLWITGKYAVRSPNEEEMGLLRYCLNAHNEVCRFVGKEEIVITNEVLTAPNPRAKLQKLAHYANILRNIGDDLEQYGILSPMQMYVTTVHFIDEHLFSLMPNAPNIE